MPGTFRFRNYTSIILETLFAGFEGEQVQMWTLDQEHPCCWGNTFPFFLAQMALDSRLLEIQSLLFRQISAWKSWNFFPRSPLKPSFVACSACGTEAVFVCILVRGKFWLTVLVDQLPIFFPLEEDSMIINSTVRRLIYQYLCFKI